MSTSILSDEDRIKFMKYLECQIYSGELILKQLEKLPMGGAVQREKAELAAQKIVYEKLRSTETFSIGTSEVKP